MGQTAPRETFIALRARRQAYRIATDILYGRTVDVRSIDCPACHSAIDPAPQAWEVACCRACGQLVPLPSHLRLKPKRKLTASEIEVAAEEERLTAYAQADAARQERYTVWFWMIVGVAVILALFFGIAS